ncbi:MAG: hypothetical protein AAGA85_24230 [Bacteroidota bacterium]
MKWMHPTIEKRSYLLAIFFSVSLTLYAQDREGSFQMGLGGLPLIYPDNSLPTGYSVRGNFGYFLLDDLAVGVMPFGGEVDNLNALGANLYARYYVVNKSVSVFLEVGAGMGRVTYDDTPQFNGTMVSLNAGPGIAYNFNRIFAIEFIPQYARLQNITHRENTNVGNVLIPTLGVQFSIPE